MQSPFRRFKNGFDFIYVGIRLVGRVPGLKFWLILPFLLDAVIIGFGVSAGTEHIRAFVNKALLFVFTKPDSMAFNFFYFPLLFLFWLVFVVLYFYMVYLLTSVMASPIFSVLAERTTRYLSQATHHPLPQLSPIQLAVRMAWVSLLRSAILLMVGVLLFTTSFVPGLNFITAFLAFVLLAFDSADYAFEVHRFHLKDRFRFLKNNIFEFFGMGAVIGLTALVPGLILLVMPFAVIGSTAVVYQIIHGHRDTLPEMR